MFLQHSSVAVSKNDSVLVIFFLYSDWFLGNSDVCFGVGFMNHICCVYCMPSLNNPRSVFKIQGRRSGQLEFQQLFLMQTNGFHNKK